MPLRRFFVLLLLPLAAACVQTTGGTHDSTQHVGRSWVDSTGMPTLRAHYDRFPTGLALAARAACGDPAETFITHSDLWFECQSLMPPEPTAGLILKYDGTMDDLPKLVISFRFSPASTGGLTLHQQNYALVPQRGGGAVRIAQPSARIDATMRALIRKSGGTPI